MILNYKKWPVLALSVALLAGCEKNLLEGNIDIATFPENGKAGLKVFHAYGGKLPSLASGTAANGPSVFLYLNGAKLNGNGLTYAISQGTWPAPSTSATNASTTYANVTPGSGLTMLGVLARVTTTAPIIPAPRAGDTVFNASMALEAGKYYTAVLSDTAPTPSVTLLQDNFRPLKNGFYKIRLAHFAAWPTDVFDVYSRREQRIIISGVSYKKASDFIELPTQQFLDTLVVIKRSGNSPLVDSAARINSFRGAEVRAYTIFLRGKTPSPTTSTTFQNFSLSLITQEF